MPDNLVNLSCRRAHNSGDCRDWKPLDALKELVKDIEDGNINPDMLYVCMREQNPSDNDLCFFPFIATGMSSIECMGLLYKHLAGAEIRQRE